MKMVMVYKAPRREFIYVNMSLLEKFINLNLNSNFFKNCPTLSQTLIYSLTIMDEAACRFFCHTRHGDSTVYWIFHHNLTCVTLGMRTYLHPCVQATMCQQ